MPLTNVVSRAAAPIFVLIWSTGFIGARFGLPYAEPMSFLALRFALAAAIFAVWAGLAGEFRLRGRSLAGAALVGVLIHGVYLGGVFTAIWLGSGAALPAMIVALQPVATALLAHAALGEAIGPRRWLGMALGVGGVALVVSFRVGAGSAGAAGIGLCLLALAGITIASVIQKRRAVRERLAADSAAQYAAAALFALVFALIFETREIDWTAEFVLTMAWMVGALSVGAISLYYYLLRRGEASETASLFFLVPGVTALLAAAMFGESFSVTDIAGVAAAMLGVRLVTHSRG